MKFTDAVHIDACVFCLHCGTKQSFVTRLWSQTDVTHWVELLKDQGWSVSPSGHGLWCPKCSRKEEAP